MKHIYNKLVRDNIPVIISKDHKTAKIQILNDDDYLKYLKLKLIEESKEVNTSQNNLADILEVIEALLNFSQISLQDVLEIKEKKALKNGKFNNRIFLEQVEYTDE